MEPSGASLSLGRVSDRTGVRLGEPAQLIGLAAQLRGAAAADELLVEAVGSLGIAVLDPAPSGREHPGLFVAGGQEACRFPGEVGGAVAVVEIGRAHV